MDNSIKVNGLLIKLPTGQTGLYFRRMYSENFKEDQWVMLISKLRTPHTPGERIKIEETEEFVCAIVFDSPEQAKGYADQFAHAAEMMKTWEEQNNEIVKEGDTD